jgi:hypothetical protein
MEVIELVYTKLKMGVEYHLSVEKNVYPDSVLMHKTLDVNIIGQ